jgi:hypothetical protein
MRCLSVKLGNSVNGKNGSLCEVGIIVGTSYLFEMITLFENGYSVK